MYMGKKMDAGDILAKEELPILDSDNQDTLFAKLSELAVTMVPGVLSDLEKGKITSIPQNENEVTFANNLTKEDEKIDFSKPARQVFNQIRGLSSNPGGYFIIDKQLIKVYNSVVSSKQHQGESGLIVAIDKQSFDISCGENTCISILELQLPSKNRMNARDFINGQGRKMLQIYKRVGE